MYTLWLFTSCVLDKSDKIFGDSKLIYEPIVTSYLICVWFFNASRERRLPFIASCRFGSKAKAIS